MPMFSLRNYKIIQYLCSLPLYNMYIIIAVVLLVFARPSIQTRLFLKPCFDSSSKQQTQQLIEIPQVYEHQFSCELIFFNVVNNCFIAQITQIPPQTHAITLTMWTNNETIHYDATNSVTIINEDRTCLFVLEFQYMNITQGIEMIMSFNVSYYVGKGNGYGNGHGEERRQNQLVREIYRERGELSSTGKVQERGNIFGDTNGPQDGEMMVQLRKAYILFNQKDQDYYIFRLPTGTIVLTTAIGLTLMLILPWNIKYRKLLPLPYNILTCSLYILLLIIAIYLQMIFGYSTTVFTVQRIIIGVFQFICMMVYTQDTLMFCIDRAWVCLGLGIVTAIVVLGCDNFVEDLKDAWFINDVIAIMIAGAFVKFVIIRKMKVAIWALLLMWVFCVIREFAKQFHIQKFDQGFGIRVLPIFVQLPTYWIDGESSLSCSAFGSSKIINFGIILNFSKRIDLYLSTQFYRSLCCILTIICVSVELVFNLLLNDLPIIEVMSVLLFYPLAVGLILFFANKRGEWAEIWDGSYYDLAVNRTLIPRVVSFEQIQGQFGKDLLLLNQSDIVTINIVKTDNHHNSNSNHVRINNNNTNSSHTYTPGIMTIINNTMNANNQTLLDNTHQQQQQQKKQQQQKQKQEQQSNHQIKQ